MLSILNFEKSMFIYGVGRGWYLLIWMDGCRSVHFVKNENDWSDFIHIRDSWNLADLFVIQHKIFSICGSTFSEIWIMGLPIFDFNANRQSKPNSLNIAQIQNLSTFFVTEVKFQQIKYIIQIDYINIMWNSKIFMHSHIDKYRIRFIKCVMSSSKTYTY